MIQKLVCCSDIQRLEVSVVRIGSRSFLVGFFVEVFRIASLFFVSKVLFLQGVRLVLRVFGYKVVFREVVFYEVVFYKIVFYEVVFREVVFYESVVREVVFYEVAFYEVVWVVGGFGVYFFVIYISYGRFVFQFFLFIWGIFLRKRI